MAHTFAYVVTFDMVKYSIFIQILHLVKLNTQDGWAKTGSCIQYFPQNSVFSTLDFTLFKPVVGCIEFHFSSRHFSNLYINQVDEVHSWLVSAQSEAPITPAGC